MEVRRGNDAKDQNGGRNHNEAKEGGDIGELGEKHKTIVSRRRDIGPHILQVAQRVWRTKH